MTTQATNLTKQDWEELAALVATDQRTETDVNRAVFSLPGHLFRISCPDDPAAIKALAERLEKAAKTPPTPHNQGSSGARKVRAATKPHPDLTGKPAKFSWAMVKALLTPDRPDGSDRRDCVANALQYLDQHGVTPVTTSQTVRKAGDMPAEILINPTALAATAKDGSAVEVYVGQVVYQNGNTGWAVANEITGLSIGERMGSQKETVKSAERAAAAVQTVQPALDKIANWPEDQGPTARVDQLRTWAGLDS